MGRHAIVLIDSAVVELDLEDAILGFVPYGT
jgi:hypothetical protein